LTFSSLGDQVNSEHYLHLDVKWTVPSPIFGGCRQQIKQAVAAALSATFLDFNERLIVNAYFQRLLSGQNVKHVSSAAALESGVGTVRNS
jgi:hypothetical protein